MTLRRLALAAALALPARAAAQAPAAAVQPSPSDAVHADTVPPAAPAEPPRRDTARATVSMIASPVDYHITLTGRVQTAWSYSAPDAAAPPVSGPVVGDTSLFRIHRARIGFSGWIYDPRATVDVQLDFGSTSALLRRAYLNYALRGKDVQLRAGRFIMPLGRMQLTSVFQQPTLDRAAVADEFGRGHDDGVMVWGAPAGGRLEYYAGLFNGDGFNRNAQQDAGNLWVGRVVLAPLGPVPYSGIALGDTRHPRFAVGASASHNSGWLYEVNGTAGLQAPSRTCAAACTTDWGDLAAVRTTAADAVLRWRGASVMAELFRRQADPRNDAAPALRASGGYAQAGVFLLPARLEAGARRMEYTPDRSARINRVTENTPFVNLYLRGADLKVMADVTWQRRTGADAPLTARRGRISLLVTF
ncbi:MAG TPA: porin [Longimicrobium sp.]|uniref:porin n=1 Tax=Longimicrobium sp. TaxID=2029185 RepID=UPI002EDB4024